jgi:hypothetical protein
MYIYLRALPNAESGQDKQRKREKVDVLLFHCDELKLLAM